MVAVHKNYRLASTCIRFCECCSRKEARGNDGALGERLKTTPQFSDLAASHSMEPSLRLHLHTNPRDGPLNGRDAGVYVDAVRGSHAQSLLLELPSAGLLDGLAVCRRAKRECRRHFPPPTASEFPQPNISRRLQTAYRSNFFCRLWKTAGMAGHRKQSQRDRSTFENPDRGRRLQ